MRETPRRIPRSSSCCRSALRGKDERLMRGRVIRVDAVVGLRAPELGVAPCTSFHRCSAPPRTSGWLLGSGREQRLECLGLRVGPARGLRHRCPGIDVGRRSEVVSVPGGDTATHRQVEQNLPEGDVGVPPHVRRHFRRTRPLQPRPAPRRRGRSVARARGPGSSGPTCREPTSRAPAARLLPPDPPAPNRPILDQGRRQHVPATPFVRLEPSSMA